MAEYCREMGLSVHPLYSARRQLKEKGLLPGAPKRRPVRKKAGKFIAVSVTEERHRPWCAECAIRPAV